MKIAVYTIAKNEGANIAQCIASAKDCDLHIVADTGSSDDTIAEARAAGATVYQIGVTPWRFDTARNVALALVPSDVDACIALDGDEVLTPGWRAIVEREWSKGITQLHYRFAWVGGVTFRRERIHARAGFHWKGHTHEGLYCDSRVPLKAGHVTDVLVIDRAQPNRGLKGGDLGALKAWALDEPYNHRAAFYHARELDYIGAHAEAESEFVRFLSLGSAWAVERSYAMRVLGRLVAKRDRVASDAWFRKAARLSPTIRAPLWAHAQCLASQKRWLECAKTLDSMFRLTVRNGDDFTEDASAWGGAPHKLLFEACRHIDRPIIVALAGPGGAP